MTGIETTIATGLCAGGVLAGILGKAGLSRIWNNGRVNPVPPPPELTPGRADTCIAHGNVLAAMGERFDGIDKRFDGLEGWMESIDKELKRKHT